MSWLMQPETWIALVALTALEIVLGIDNLVFITILAGNLPKDNQTRAGRVGLGAAMLTRILLLLSIAWLSRLTATLFVVLNVSISARDLILLAGGLFLIGKSTFEIHDKLEGKEGGSEAQLKRTSFEKIIVQIMLLDIIFSLDSVITAVGMANEVSVMIAAIVIAVGIMALAVGAINDFVGHHPTIKMLALAFLLLIGFSLVMEGLHQHIPKGYIYFAMAFSVFVEILNTRLRAHSPQPVRLHEAYTGKTKGRSA